MTKNLFYILFSFTIASVVVACQPKRGCTDSYSDNFDPEAKQDDDTCVPTRFKFVGKYDCHGTIETGEDTLVPYDQVFVNIEDSTANNPNELIIGVSHFDEELYALSAVTTGTYTIAVSANLGAYKYWGTGEISGRVLTLDMTRTELVDEVLNLHDTLQLHIYGLQEIVE
jgi:hypothetical protein